MKRLFYFLRTGMSPNCGHKFLSKKKFEVVNNVQKHPGRQQWLKLLCSPSKCELPVHCTVRFGLVTNEKASSLSTPYLGQWYYIIADHPMKPEASCTRSRSMWSQNVGLLQSWILWCTLITVGRLTKSQSKPGLTELSCDWSNVGIGHVSISYLNFACPVAEFPMIYAVSATRLSVSSRSTIVANETYNEKETPIHRPGCCIFFDNEAYL